MDDREVKEKLKPYVDNIDLEEKLESMIIEIKKEQLKYDESKKLSLPPAALDAINKNIEKLKRDKNRLEKEIKQYEVLEEKENTQQELEQEEQHILKLINDYDIAYICDQGIFVYCKSTQNDNADIMCPVQKHCDSYRFGRVLNYLGGRTLKYSRAANREALIDLFEKHNRTFDVLTFSFIEDKWCKKKAFNFAPVLRKYWVQPDWENSDNYDPRFDFWMYCLSGGKKENQDHIEQLIGYRYLYPERAGQTPNIDIGGQPGGNGKGLLNVCLSTIHTNSCVNHANRKELNEGFNKHWGYSIYLFYDESGEKELPQNQLKKLTGNDTFMLEGKGQDAIQTDRGCTLIFTSNNAAGIAQLAGTGDGGEDRRWSCVKTDRVMVEEAQRWGLATPENVGEFVSSIYDMLKRRSVVAVWLAHIIKKHDIQNMKTLKALHGQDYRERINEQKTTLDLVFDSIFPIFQQNRCIPVGLLEDLVRAMTRNTNYKTKGVVLKWQEYLKKQRCVFEKARLRLTHYYNKAVVFTNENAVSVFVMDRSATSFDYTDLLNRRPIENQTITEDMIKIEIDVEGQSDSEFEEITETNHAKVELEGVIQLRKQQRR